MHGKFSQCLQNIPVGIPNHAGRFLQELLLQFIMNLNSVIKSFKIDILKHIVES